MWTVSFTFKYLPNIIQKFCTHVAVRDTLALTAWASHVRNLLCHHHHTCPGCVVCDGLEVQCVRSRPKVDYP